MDWPISPINYIPALNGTNFASTEYRKEEQDFRQVQFIAKEWTFKSSYWFYDRKMKATQRAGSDVTWHALLKRKVNSITLKCISKEKKIQPIIQEQWE